MVPDDYGALEPSISGKIMELHHSKHHQTYVNSFNDASEKIATAKSKGEIQGEIALQPLINFHGGGHVNHSLFWENLAPAQKGGGEPPKGKLEQSIKTTYGTVGDLQKVMNTALAGIQGSGWAWLVKDKQTGAIGVRTYAASALPLDAHSHVLTLTRTKTRWLVNSCLCLESTPGNMLTSRSPTRGRYTHCTNAHGSLQYQNRKAEYFNAIWNVINWEAAEKRFESS